MSDRPDRAPRQRLSRLADATREVEAELEYHVERRTQELIETGHDPELARRIAYVAFGDRAAVQRTCERIQRRRRRRWVMMHWVKGFLSEVGSAWRVLFRQPGYTLLAVLTLALGIGANTAIFSAVHGILLSPLPYPEPLSLVQVWGSVPGRPTVSASPADYLDWRKARSFEAMASYSRRAENLIGGSTPVRVTLATVSGNFFDVFGVDPALGRAFEPDPGGTGSRMVMLGHGLWTRVFGSDPSIVGRSLRLDDRTFQVVGVMPPGFAFPSGVELWTRAPFDVPEIRSFTGDITQMRDAWYFSVVGRIGATSSFEAAQDEMSTIAAQLAEAYSQQNADRDVRLVPLLDQMVGPVRATLFMLLGAVGLVLLIACANIANLGVVRVLGREPELAVRASLGASRSRLVGVALAENMWVGTLGGALGIVFAVAGIRLLSSTVLGSLPRGAEVTFEPRLLVYSMALTLLAIGLFSLLPATLASAVEPARGLAPGRGSGLGGRKRRMMAALVASETALAVVLVLGAGLILKSLWQLQQIDLGFEIESYTGLWVALPGARAIPVEERIQFYEGVRDQVQALSGVEAAALAQTHPLSRGPGAGLRVFGRANDPSDMRSVQWQVVTEGYFETLGLGVLAGRTFEPLDGNGSEDVAVVNETLARMAFGEENPVGRQINTGLDGRAEDGEWQWVRVVGVVSDTRNRGPRVAAAPMMYRPLRQAPDFFGGGSMMVVARTPSAPAGIVSRIREAVWRLDASVPVFGEQTGSELARGYVAGQRLVLGMLGSFAALALTLGAIGIYGVTAYGVRRGARDIGVRLAMGARRGQVLYTEALRGSIPGFLGVVLGALAALLASPLIAGFMFQTSSFDPVTYTVVCGLLAAVCVAATVIPAIRASQVDPVQTLRLD